MNEHDNFLIEATTRHGDSAVVIYYWSHDSLIEIEELSYFVLGEISWYYVPDSSTFYFIGKSPVGTFTDGTYETRFIFEKILLYEKSVQTRRREKIISSQRSDDFRDIAIQGPDMVFYRNRKEIERIPLRELHEGCLSDFLLGDPLDEK